MVEKSKSLVPAPASRDPPELADRRGVAAVLWGVVTAAEYRPLAPPQVPPDLPDMPLLPRLHACLRLFLLDVEYVLSPGGQLRGLAKLTCRVAIVAGLLTLKLAVVLACAASVLGLVVLISGQIAMVLSNLLQAALALAGLVTVGVGWLLTVRFLTYARPAAVGVSDDADRHAYPGRGRMRLRALRLRQGRLPAKAILCSCFRYQHALGMHWRFPFR